MAGGRLLWLSGLGLMLGYLLWGMPASSAIQTHSSGATQIPLTAVAIDGREVLTGYRIGRYPPQEQWPDAYRPLQYLYRVSEAEQETPLSPSFVVRQFLCKQESGWPKYLWVEPKLLGTLERILAFLKAQGVELQTLTIMSGYRTPWYNQSLGNGERSRHIYGDAADLFVDVDGDGQMDDLNKDGRVDIGDAQWLVALINSQFGSTRDGFLGGLSAYPATPYHGPFVHIDLRGTVARWGAHQP